MFHESTDLLGASGPELWELVCDFKKKEYVQKVGVSVYTPEVLVDIINKYEIDIVQFPLNIFDQRFIPFLEKLKSKRVEIHTRSTFLQGLLLMKSIPDYFEEIKDKIMAIPEPHLQYALAFGKKQKEVDRMIIGVTKLQDLKEIVDAYNSEVEVVDYSQYALNDEKYINPAMWKVKK